MVKIIILEGEQKLQLCEDQEMNMKRFKVTKEIRLEIMHLKSSLKTKRWTKSLMRISAPWTRTLPWRPKYEQKIKEMKISFSQTPSNHQKIQ